MKRRILLIDADILVYQVACSAEVPIDWGEDFWTLHSDFQEARTDLDGRIEAIKDTLGGDEMLFALTTTDKNFRKDVYPQYKSNRKATRKPLVWKPLRQYLHDTYGDKVFERPCLEGDDCLGILATKLGPLTKTSAPGWERILVSIDKDFKGVPCKYYNLNKPDEGVIEISEAEADYFFMLQTLTGDTTDGYPGCPGIGPKKAAEALEPFNNLKDWWQAVVSVYRRAGLGEDVALSQARCARILRASDYDFKNKKPKLWEVPK